MNPTWYDVLGVSRDASPTQIKAAWREVTDKFEPGSGSGQFRMFNEAADVLLDPARRAEYDASLGEDAPSAPPPAAAEPVRDPVAVPVSEPVSTPVPEPVPAEPELEAERREAVPRRLTTTALAVLAVLTVLAAGAVVAALHFSGQVREDNAITDAREQAPAVAEKAATAMLSYDYRQLPADARRASAFMTPAYRTKYLATFALLEKNKDGSPGAAVQTQAVVNARVQDTAVIDASPDLARVLVFVNQESTKTGQQPQIFQNRVAMTLVQQGGRWLVSDLKSY